MNKIFEFRGVSEFERTVRSRIIARGEWDDEPDEMLWRDNVTGLPCIARRNNMFAWCGHVGVPKTLVFDEDTVQVHWGLTGAIQYKSLREIELRWAMVFPDVDWMLTRWPGFDCSHIRDISPTRAHERRYDPDTVYRNRQFVIEQCARLAKGLHHWIEIERRVR